MRLSRNFAITAMMPVCIAGCSGPVHIPFIDTVVLLADRARAEEAAKARQEERYAFHEREHMRRYDGQLACLPSDTYEEGEKIWYRDDIFEVLSTMGPSSKCDEASAPTAVELRRVYAVRAGQVLTMCGNPDAHVGQRVWSRTVVRVTGPTDRCTPDMPVGVDVLDGRSGQILALCRNANDAYVGKQSEGMTVERVIGPSPRCTKPDMSVRIEVRHN